MFSVIACARFLCAADREAEPTPHQENYHIDGSCTRVGPFPAASEGPSEIYGFKLAPEANLKTTVSQCSLELQNGAKDFVKKEAANAFVSPSTEGLKTKEDWQLLLSFDQLKPKRCAVLHNSGQNSDLLILRTVVPRRAKGWDKFRQAHPSRPNELVDDPELLSLIQLDRKGNSMKSLGQYVSLDWFGDSRLLEDVRYICDTDGDGYAEIILNIQLYAGYRYNILSFNKDFSALHEEDIVGGGGD